MRVNCNWILLFVITLAVGVFFRVYRLSDRPMHTDEAVHAEKFKTLLEEGSYTYDPSEYHGPALNYLTLVSAMLCGKDTYAEVTEPMLRIVPAIIGFGLIFTPLFFIKELGRRSILFCCMLIAFSPAFVYYSRYYIQEILLVFFTACFLGSLWRYLQSGHFSWAVFTGICAGLMHATKETFILAIAAAGAAILLYVIDGKRFKPVKDLHIYASLTAMSITSAVLFSSFGKNPQGIIDSLLTYHYWLQRAGGSGFHVHPWYYYLDLLTWTEFLEPICWNEDIIVAAGGIAALVMFFGKKNNLRGNGLFVFFLFYTIILTLMYHVIPYKTPWCMLSFLYGMAILAGITLDRFIGILKDKWQTVIAGTIIGVFVIIVPFFQCWMLNFKYYADQRNPYVYGHTTCDVFEMMDAVEKAVVGSDEGKSLPIYVIAAGDDYWPMPWYLREYDRVGYWSDVDDSVCSAKIVLANADVEEKLLATLYSVPESGEKNMYLPLFDRDLYLRPHVPWRGYVRKELLDKSQIEGMLKLPEKINSESVIMNQQNKNEISNLLKFNHQAMNTDFQIFIQDTREEYAGRAAREAFREVDRLEGLLSRFIDNSDISRINGAEPGREIVVDDDTFACISNAYQAWRITEGYFDVTVGKLINVSKSGEQVNNDQSLNGRSSMDMLELNPETSTVTVTNQNIKIDLGGIGKGYAVDVIWKTLKIWGINTALISAGSSSVMALDGPQGKKGWPVTISDLVDGKVIKRLYLNNEVLSTSGIKKGGHIINPFTGESVTDRKACWVRLNTNAALADAFSTAAMVMPADTLMSLSDQVDGLWLIVLMTDDNVLLKIGDWPDD